LPKAFVNIVVTFRHAIFNDGSVPLGSSFTELSCIAAMDTVLRVGPVIGEFLGCAAACRFRR
jgi:hypothetical protein